jgi:hypothetical protein
MQSHDPWTLRDGNIHCVPIHHYSLEFAEHVRLVAQVVRPDAVAVELPPSLEEAFLRAIRRLPLLSVILFQDKARRTLYLPVEPADGIVEAARFACERDLPLYLVDLDVENYPLVREAVPDSYAVSRLGLGTYYEAYRSVRAASGASSVLDLRREQAMAYHLSSLRQRHSSILFVCGMAHAQAVMEHVRAPQARPLEKTKRDHVQLFHVHPECLDETMSTFPFLSSVYELRRRGIPDEVPEYDRLSVRKRLGRAGRGFEILERGSSAGTEQEVLRASLHRVARRCGGQCDCGGSGTPSPLDRNLFLVSLFDEAARHYSQETGEAVVPWQKAVFWKFVRNYALQDGLLLPDFYHLLAGARASVDDNFCYAFWRLGSFYPWQQEAASDAPSLRMRGEDLWLGTRRLTVRRWFPRKRLRPLLLPDRRRRREARPGEWQEHFNAEALCSYPPEDIVIEDYGRQLQKKCVGLVTDESSSAEPFTVSLLEGIDVRETIRHWSERRVYVRRQRKMAGGVGSIVVVFDEDDKNERYPYCMTWLGEHEQESDMAFYATPPEDHIVGPGICRCEYGGFLMTYPPRRLYDIWKDPDYVAFQRKADRLLAAALEYSQQPTVVYVAARPPRSYMKTVAERLRRRILYVPIGSLSWPRLKKIRVFHILSGYDKRAIAKDYIW